MSQLSPSSPTYSAPRPRHVEPFGHVEGDPCGDILSLDRQSETGTALYLNHVAPPTMGVGEDRAGMTSFVDVQPQRNGERLETRERLVQQERVTNRAQLRELEVRIEANSCNNDVPLGM